MDDLQGARQYGMKRRDLILGAGAALTGAAAVTALTVDPKPKQSSSATKSADLPSPSLSRGIRRLRLTTSWPKNFPGLGEMPNRFAQYMQALTDGEIEVQVFAAGELVGALAAFDTVSSGGADIYHAAEYYWQGKSKGFTFFTAVPLGMTAAEIMAWVEFGGGQALWDDLAAGFNIKAMHAGNTGHQMGGWFKREINSLEDFKGLKMRMPGLGGEVIRRLGGAAVQLSGGEIYQSLRSGAIDATEWVGPWNDLAFGFFNEAPYYYGPGFHEPGAALSVGFNLDVWNSLTASQQAAAKVAAATANNVSLGEYTHQNAKALVTLKQQHGITPRTFPDDVWRKIGRISEDVVNAMGDADAQTRKIYESYHAARNTYRTWTEISEAPYVRLRAEALKGL